MRTCIDKLLEIGSASLCGAPLELVADCSHSKELSQLAARRNGFYAFESALHVFPMGAPCAHMTAEAWNDRGLWKQPYGPAAETLWCFAEDVFGNQFASSGGDIVLFDAEAGEVTKIADSVEEWACRILTDYEYLTGYPFAHEWQEKNGPLPEGTRLAPKIPFVFGGEYEYRNFYFINAVSGMRLRADIYAQSRHLADGARVALKVEKD